LKNVTKILFLPITLVCLSSVGATLTYADSADSEVLSEQSTTDAFDNTTPFVVGEKENRAGNYGFNSYVFLQYKPHTGGKIQPSSNPIWQVKYVSGKKKQGWVYWTGKYTNAGRVGAYFDFKGTLK